MLAQKDREILQKILQKDEKVLYEFYQEHKKPLLQFITKHLNDSDAAEEVLQDTFLGFIESLRDFRGQSSLKTFLYSIAKNKVVDKLRKKKLKQIFFSHVPSFFVESFAAVFLDEELDRKHLTKKIEGVFGKLPNDYAEVLRLKYREGYKVAEIAKRIKLSFKATESLLFRARKAFIVVYNTYERYDIYPASKKT